MPLPQSVRAEVTSKPWLAVVLGAFACGLLECGGRTSSLPAPVVLSVSLSSSLFNLTSDGAALLIPVTIVAPTETASFVIGGLPAGVSAMYKESESNPSGLLTLTAAATTVAGTYMPQITVGSSGQTASTGFSLVIQAAEGK